MPQEVDAKKTLGMKLVRIRAWTDQHMKEYRYTQGQQVSGFWLPTGDGGEAVITQEFLPPALRARPVYTMLIQDFFDAFPFGCPREWKILCAHELWHGAVSIDHVDYDRFPIIGRWNPWSAPESEVQAAVARIAAKWGLVEVWVEAP